MILRHHFSAKVKKTILLVTIFIIAVSVPIQIIGGRVSADEYDDQIAALQAQIDSYNAQSAVLADQARTLQSTVDNLANQAKVIQAQIDISQAKYDQLIAQIADTEKQIADNKDALGVTLADLYVDDNVTPVEIIFSSKNISEYMDKQEYRSSIRNELTATITRIKELKAQLETQKAETEVVLTDQKNQRAALDAKKAEQQKILDDTKGQEAAFQDLVRTSDAEIASLRSQQIAANLARANNYGGDFTSLPGDGTRGGYPINWMSDAAMYYCMSDDWGMCQRQCVSYAAFKVAQSYGNMPYWGGIGNANQWDDNARNWGIPIGTTPKPGSVGVMDSGYYGHVAWVESVNANGTINISHFNINWNGDYAEWYNVNSGFFDYYIYFGEWNR